MQIYSHKWVLSWLGFIKIPMTILALNLDNHIGQTLQYNGVGKHISDWSVFFWEFRLLFQIELAKQNGYLNTHNYKQLLSIEKLLSNLLDININPTLLHGDLWSGNVLSGKNNPYFIDPASYYDHCEAYFA